MSYHVFKNLYTSREIWFPISCQLTFTCSKSTIKTLEKYVICVPERRQVFIEQKQFKSALWQL